MPHTGDEVIDHVVMRTVPSEVHVAPCRAHAW